MVNSATSVVQTVTAEGLWDMAGRSQYCTNSMCVCVFVQALRYLPGVAG